MALIHRRHLIRLEREVDVFTARELAATLASVHGFDRYQASDIETAISELATNALKYGKRGLVSLRIDATGLEAVITDEGPGFGAAPKSRSGLGVGLAGVERLMDTLRIESLELGSRVAVRKNLRTSHAAEELSTWSIDVVGRTRSGRSVSGDGYWIRDRGESLLVAVTDGLGAGQGAAQASASVVESFEMSDPRTPLDEMTTSAHQHARSTRGAVCLLARIDPGSQSIEYTGVGDISGFIDPRGERLAMIPGILGVDDPEMRSTRLPWAEHSRLIAWTDGIDMPHEELSRLETETTMPVGDWAEEMALAHGVDRDDGLILVARRTSRK